MSASDVPIYGKGRGGGGEDGGVWACGLREKQPGPREAATATGPGSKGWEGGVRV